jgi:tetratricopeptide (TPR) repeat protein
MALSLDEAEDHASARRIAEKLSPWFPTGVADRDWLAVLEVVQRIVLDVQDQMNLPASILIDERGQIAKLYDGPVEPAQLVEDVRALARTDEDIIGQTSPYAKGTHHVVIPHSKAIRLLQLSEALIANQHPILAQYFADALVDQLASYPTLASTQKRAGRVFVELARAFGPSDSTRAAACAKRGDAFFVLASRRYAANMASNPADHQAWFGFGECLDSITDPILADEAVREALHGIPPPASPADLRERGKDVFNLQRWEEAIPYLEQALRANPDDVNTQYRLGTALMRLGRTTEGIPHVERALSILPPHPVAEFNFARDLQIAGDRDRAIEHYRKTLELDPAYDPARQALRELGAEPPGD